MEQILNLHEYMFKFDIKQGCHHIDIYKPHQKCFGYSWEVEGKTCYFVFSVLPFGLTSAPLILRKQGCSEGTSSVSFEVLIINCQMYFINLFILNCLTLNIKLFIFKLFGVKYLCPKNHVFRKQNKTAVYGLMDVASLVSDFKLTRENDDLLSLDINKFVRYRTLCKSILKCGFLTKGIELTRFVLFQVLGGPKL